MTPWTPISRPLLTAIAVAAALALATGCADMRDDWSSVPESKEPKVNLVRYAHAVHFAAGSSHLESGELALLDDFLARVQAGQTDTVVVAGAEGDAALAARRRDTVTAYLVHRAVQPRPGSAASAIEAAGPDSVSVIVQRYAVTLPNCPDWSDRPGRNWNNTVGRNWGCATATNLGLMVADPADLLAGRRPGPMDGEAAVLAIQRYRAGETRPLTPEDVGSTQKQQKSTSGTTSSGASE